MKYLIIIEKTQTGYSAYSPDVPGYVATGATRKDVEHTMRDVIQFHLEGLKTEGYELPKAHSYSKYLEVVG